jgi:hypothetical protein
MKRQADTNKDSSVLRATKKSKGDVKTSVRTSTDGDNRDLNASAPTRDEKEDEVETGTNLDDIGHSTVKQHDTQATAKEDEEDEKETKEKQAARYQFLEDLVEKTSQKRDSTTISFPGEFAVVVCGPNVSSYRANNANLTVDQIIAFALADIKSVT